jgi:hypothetical protein
MQAMQLSGIFEGKKRIYLFAKQALFLIFQVAQQIAATPKV